jgi:hypothetical protein
MVGLERGDPDRGNQAGDRDHQERHSLRRGGDRQEHYQRRQQRMQQGDDGSHGKGAGTQVVRVAVEVEGDGDEQEAQERAAGLGDRGVEVAPVDERL